MAIKKMKSIILVTTMVLGLLSLSGCSKKEEAKDVEVKLFQQKI